MSTQITISGQVPYKSYVALLTQEGVEDKHEYIVNFGEIVGLWPTIPAGTTMLIVQNDSKSDFTISGAPNNVAGTWFIYNGIPPKIFAPERVGGIVDIGYDLGAPIATVLENTIGNIWFTYNNPGDYSLNSTGLFAQNKTTVMIGSAFENVNNSSLSGIVRGDDNVCTIATVVYPTVTGTDGYLQYTPIEIRVYNSGPLLATNAADPIKQVAEE